MGATFGCLLSRIFKPKVWKIIMLGLDRGGKTTILYKLKLDEVVETLPTIGFNLETLEHKDIRFEIFDVQSQDKIRPLWKHYFQDTKGLVWVVDSADRERIAESSEELSRVLKADELRDTVLLVLANKQDLPDAMSNDELIEKLGLESLQGRRWHVQSTSATKGQGLREALDWLAVQFTKE